MFSGKDVMARNRAGAGLMLAAMLLAALIPLALLRGGSSQEPFLFNGFWRLGAAAGVAAFLLAFLPRLCFSGLVWAAAARQLRRGLFFLSLLNSAEFALLSWAARVSDLSVALTVQQVYPIFVIMLLGWLFRAEGRYRRNLAGLLPWLLLSALGAGLAVAGYAGGFGGGAGVSGPGLALGVVFSLLSAGAAACGAGTVRWGRDLAAELAEAGSGPAPEPAAAAAGLAGGTEIKGGFSRLEMFGMALALGLVSLAGAGGSLALGFLLEGGVAALSRSGDAGGVAAVGPGRFLWTALLGGFLLHAGNGLLFRAGTGIAENLAVNGIVYAALPLSLALLVLLGWIAVAHWPLFCLGAGLILAGGLGANRELLAALGSVFKSRWARRRPGTGERRWRE